MREKPTTQKQLMKRAGVLFCELAPKIKKQSKHKKAKEHLKQENKKSSKKTGLQHTKWNMLCIGTLESLLKDQWKTCDSVKINGKYHESHTRQVVEDSTEKEGKIDGNTIHGQRKQ